MSFIAPLTGIVSSLGTSWGLFRHYWVLVKLLMTIPSTAILMVHMQPISRIADVARDFGRCRHRGTEKGRPAHSGKSPFDTQAQQAGHELKAALFAAAALWLASSAVAGAQRANKPKYPTAEFAPGAKSASVTVGDVTAGISLVRRPDIDPSNDVPVLQVIVAGTQALEVPGVASGMEQPAAEASIAEIDPGNRHPEVYFASYSGGVHCCTHVIIAEELATKWVSVTVGDFDGAGRYLDDLDGDGVAEIVAVDNRFLYQFDCYACSAAPLQILTVRDGNTDKRYLAAHRDWLKRMEAEADPDKRWTLPGFLAGWVAAKVRVGEGADAFKQLTEHWNYSTDVGEEVCLTGGELDACDKKSRSILKFPDRLKLFLQQSGYAF